MQTTAKDTEISLIYITLQRAIDHITLTLTVVAAAVAVTPINKPPLNCNKVE